MMYIMFADRLLGSIGIMESHANFLLASGVPNDHAVIHIVCSRKRVISIGVRGRAMRAVVDRTLT